MCVCFSSCFYTLLLLTPDSILLLFIDGFYIVTYQPYHLTETIRIFQRYKSEPLIPILSYSAIFHYIQNILGKKFLTRATRLVTNYVLILPPNFSLSCPCCSPKLYFLSLNSLNVPSSLQPESFCLCCSWPGTLWLSNSGLATSYSPLQSQHKCHFPVEVFPALPSSPEG